MTKTESPPLALAQLRQQAVEAYRALAVGIARGESPVAEDLRQVLWAAGRSLETLEADVARLRARYEAADALAQAEAMGETIDLARAVEKAATDNLAAAEAEARRVVAKAAERFEAATQERRALDAKRTELLASRRVLVETADAELDAELRRLRAVESGLQRRIEPARRLRAEVEAARRRAETFEQTKGPDFAPPWFAGRGPGDELAEAEEKLRRNADVLAQADAADAELADVRARMAEVESEKLRPEAMRW